ncbi:MAG TPA: dihydroneopterin aldolase [Clostridia bacterium]|nr:dihydroneopterin aldolase [Clostridia bacterium]
MTDGDIIMIKGLTIWARHGVFPEENKYGQRFIVDLEAVTDATEVCLTDDISKGASYSYLFECANKVVGGEQHKTLQRIAHRVAEEVLKDERIKEVRVTIKKPFVPLGGILDYSGVSIVRRKY